MGGKFKIRLQVPCSLIFIVYNFKLLFFPVALKPLPNDKVLDVNRLKAFAYDKLIIPKVTTSLFDRVENTLGKGENPGYQHFLLFPHVCVFQAFFFRVVQSQDCVVKKLKRINAHQVGTKQGVHRLT